MFKSSLHAAITVVFKAITIEFKSKNSLVEAEEKIQQKQVSSSTQCSILFRTDDLMMLCIRK